MKKGMVNVLILALVLVNLILSIVLVFTFVPAIKKTSNLVDKVCQIVELDVNGDESDGKIAIEDLEYKSVTWGTSLEETQIYTLLSNGESIHHVKIGATLVINTKHADYKSKITTVSNAMGAINSVIGDVVSEYTYKNATTSKTEMEQRILKELQSMFNSDFIYDFTFTQFIIS